MGARDFDGRGKIVIRNVKKWWGPASKFALVMGALVLAGWAQSGATIPYFDLGIRPARGGGETALALQLLFLLTILTLAPSILLMMTAFVRTVIILKFVQRALSLQQEPPNQVIMGMALFITFFVMAPTFTQIYEKAYLPFSQNRLTTDQFFDKSLKPLRDFMFKQTREKDIDLFLYLGKYPRPRTPDDVPTVALIPAFMISELTTAFSIGILIFIPFIVIDMVVASILMSMGMIMVPPVMISMPVKIILFVLVDGWHLITLQTVKSFHMF